MTELNAMIDAIVDQDFATAAPTFNEILAAKMNDALDQEKINVANQMFNGAEADLDEDDPSEDEVDAALDELEDDADELEVDEEEQ